MSLKPKRLTVGNTSRFYNSHLILRDEIDQKIKVTRLNEDEIEENMDYLAEKSRRIPLRDGNEYLLFQERYPNDTLTKKIISHGGGVTYYTSSVVPYHVTEQLSQNLNSEVVYLIRERFSPKEQENVELNFMATRVIVDVPVVLPTTNPYDVLFALHDLKTNVDHVQFSFLPLREGEITEEARPFYEYRNGKYRLKAIYQFEFFKYIQTSLSIWGMNIYLISEDHQAQNELHSLIEQDKDRKNPGRKKKKKKKRVEQA